MLAMTPDEARILELTLRRWGRRSIVLTLAQDGRVTADGRSYADRDVKAAQDRLRGRAGHYART